MLNIYDIVKFSLNNYRMEENHSSTVSKIYCQNKTLVTIVNRRGELYAGHECCTMCGHQARLPFPAFNI